MPLEEIDERIIDMVRFVENYPSSVFLCHKTLSVASDVPVNHRAEEIEVMSQEDYLEIGVVYNLLEVLNNGILVLVVERVGQIIDNK